MNCLPKSIFEGVARRIFDSVQSGLPEEPLPLLLLLPETAAATGTLCKLLLSILLRTLPLPPLPTEEEKLLRSVILTDDDEEDFSKISSPEAVLPIQKKTTKRTLTRRAFILGKQSLPIVTISGAFVKK
jgi:hypothetical protein